ncbi:hypothetical protein EV363DRAFT_1208032 [Boletus edulis]|uniref:Uncharacterized protein n=1 Tax=Boletus edulis BED1 TaxID=1328754 RepID=A0AAD4C6V3_BOLED|nr:hypothetical protein EV363DRAFT_1208032 [Boletus edulis]KAF8450596.1 hypothetical protein L210DRAFT_907423 [Boletus edulis BED1]
MEYNPRYPQPFSLSQAIALDPAVAWDEIARLRNSLLHLRRSQIELQECLRELGSEEMDVEVSQAVKENEITMHDERIFMLKLALTHHGYSGASEQTYEPLTSFPSTPPGSRAEGLRNATVSSSNGLDDFPHVERASVVNQETPGAEEQENGVYL